MTAKRLSILSLVALTTILVATGCTAYRHQAANALTFLYPDGHPAVQARDVTLTLPLRVGVAFSPGQWNAPGRGLDEVQRQALLSRVAKMFESRPGIASAEVIPGNHLVAPRNHPRARVRQDGFQSLDRIRAAFGIDLILLISYDQQQVSGSGNSSIAYWTLVGAYVVKGEKNDTTTMMNAVVYDIPSRALLVSADGHSSIGGKSTPVKVDRSLRRLSAEGFQRATDDLIANLDVALDAFQVQAATGTVRGPGTPAIAMFDAKGNPVDAGRALGAAGAWEIGASLAVLLLVIARGRTRPIGRPGGRTS